jgi:cardiolipin synthase
MEAQVIIGSPANGSERMHLMYLMAIAAAEESIDIATPYFVPDSLTAQAILAARRRGVRIRVLGPGPYTDSKVTLIASKADWKQFLQTGVEFHNYQPSLFHNKLLIVDRELVSVGSPNFDERSLMLNDETSLNVYDRGFAETMTAVFEADLGRARPYTLAMWEQRPLREKLVERFVLPIKSQL